MESRSLLTIPLLISQLQDTKTAPSRHVTLLQDLRNSARADPIERRNILRQSWIKQGPVGPPICSGSIELSSPLSM